jgi:hypothetical protein
VSILLLERHRQRCEEDIKTNLRETGYVGVGVIPLDQDGNHWRALVNTVLNFGFHRFGQLLSGFSLCHYQFLMT